MNLKIKSRNERQMNMYLGLKNYNLRSTDSSRNLNSVSACRVKAEGFYVGKEWGHLHE